MKKSEPRYSTFYRTMLILSTIGTSFGILGLLSIPEMLANLEHARLYVICMLLLCVVTLVSIVALVMLWQKKHLGYLLKLSTYVVIIIICTVSLFNVDAYSQHIVNESIIQMAEEGVGGPQMEQITRAVLPFATKAAVVMSIVQAVVFGLLWRAAWKKQLAYDKENA